MPLLSCCQAVADTIAEEWRALRITSPVGVDGAAGPSVPAWLQRLLASSPLRRSARALTHPPIAPATIAPAEACAAIGVASSSSLPVPPLVYVHQRELALVSPDATGSPPSIAFTGSGDATTCVIVILVCASTQRTIVSHLDGASRTQIIGNDGDASADERQCSSIHAALNSLTAADVADGIDVHLAGGFQMHQMQQTASESEADATADAEDEAADDAEDESEFAGDDSDAGDEIDQADGLVQVRDILLFLHRYSTTSKRLGGSRHIAMRLRTLCVGPLNTQWAAEAPAESEISASHSSSSLVLNNIALPAVSYPRPYLTSFFYHFPTRTVGCLPSTYTYTRGDRGPSMILRCLRGGVGLDNLSHAYDELRDEFVIRPFRYGRMNVAALRGLLALPDPEFLLRSSTSPLVEPPNFLPDMREAYGWLVAHPNWRDTFVQGEAQPPMRFRREPGTNRWTEVPQQLEQQP